MVVNVIAAYLNFVASAKARGYKVARPRETESQGSEGYRTKFIAMTKISEIRETNRRATGKIK